MQTNLKSEAVTERQAKTWARKLKAVKPSRYHIDIVRGHYGNWIVTVSLDGSVIARYASIGRLRAEEEM